MLEAYGAWGDKVMYGKKMKGIIRSTVLIGKDGKVVKHWPKVSVKGHAADGRRRNQVPGLTRFAGSVAP